MAAENLGGISSALATTFSTRLRRVWNRVAVTAATLQMESAVGQGGGKQIGWDVEFSGATANNLAEGSDIQASEFNVDPIVPAILPFGMYRSAFQLSNLEIKAASANVANAAELGRIVMERLDGSLTKMASRANADFWTGTGVDASGNPTIIGFPAALDPNAPYAGINKNTFPEWAGNVLANGGVGRPLTFDLLYQADQVIYTASGKTAKVIICSPDVYRKYADLFETIKRVFVGPNGEVPAFSGGERELSWKGMPVLRDKDMAAGTLGMLNTDDIRIRPLAGMANQDGVAVQTRQLPSSNGEEYATTPLFVDVYPLARTGSAQKFVAEMYLQLQVQRTNSHCYIKDIS
ncbi:MAG: phage major capsid protein [Polyangiaceae bacterium]|nr:phage major capsid protein [Polyangiaceae bacterium]